MSNGRHAQSIQGLTETATIPASELSRELTAIRRNGGHVCQSAPVGRNEYRVTVFWR